MIFEKVREYKNGKIVCTVDSKLKVTVEFWNWPTLKVSVSDKLHRYYYHTFYPTIYQGEKSSEFRKLPPEKHCTVLPYPCPTEPTQIILTFEQKLHAAEAELDAYLPMRGERTSWCPWIAVGKYQGAIDEHQ